MFKKLPVLFALFFQFTFAQVGIGTTTPNASSSLEIKSSNSGILIPRVNLTSTSDATTILSPVTSLLVYNLNTQNDVSPGFYYWDTTWKPLKSTSTGSGSGWNLTGNNVVSTDYLGTNNYFPLIFKVNNTQFVRLHPGGGIAVGNSSVANDNNSIAIGTLANASANNQATAIGPSAIASGFQSTALGYLATASSNSAIALGLSSIASGFQSIALGLSANASNNNSVALGANTRASGQQSTAVGTEANASGQNATAIGYQAVAMQANSIILGKPADTNNKIGIGTATPTERLHVDGSVRIVDGTQANNYVLTSDATGKASWKDPNVNIAYADIYRTSNLQLPNGVISFNTVGENSNMNNVSTTGIQVKTTGVYRITYSMTFQKTNGGLAVVQVYLGKDSAEIPGTRVIQTVESNDYETVSISKIVSVTAFQTISVLSSAANTDVAIIGNSASLSLELIK